MASSIAALVGKQRGFTPAVPAVPRSAPRTHMAGHASHAWLSFDDNGRQLVVMMMVMLASKFFNADDLVAASMVGIELELSLGWMPAHLCLMLLLLVHLLLMVHLLLLSEMSGPAGVFDLESWVEGELVRLMLLVHFRIVVMAARSRVDEVPLVRVV